MEIISNETIESLFRKAYTTKNPGLEKRQIKFPQHLSLSKDPKEKKLLLNMLCNVTENMQSDVAAFEAWVLALKVWIPEFKDYTISLTWHRPADINDGHYQRFLYRAFKFKELFPGWFSLIDEGLLSESKLSYISGKPSTSTYHLNSPERAASQTAQNEEAKLERNLLHAPAFNAIFDFEKKGQQLPVGVFADRVTRDTAIFTHGHSDIDLWGLSKGQGLNIFELKKMGNNKIGIITELMFYTLLMEDLRRQKITYPDTVLPVGRETPSNLSPKTPICAWLLAPKLHPLVSPSLVSLINAAFANRDIKFKHMCFSYTKNQVGRITVSEITSPW